MPTIAAWMPGRRSCRPPGPLRRLEPDDLRRESEEAVAFGSVLMSRLGPMPSITARRGRRSARRMPLTRSLATGGRSTTLLPRPAATAMTLLKRHGIATVTTHGQPGARGSLRLKPVLGVLTKAGGAVWVSDASSPRSWRQGLSPAVLRWSGSFFSGDLGLWRRNVKERSLTCRMQPKLTSRHPIGSFLPRRHRSTGFDAVRHPDAMSRVNPKGCRSASSRPTPERL